MNSPSLRFSLITYAVLLVTSITPALAHAQYVQIQQVSPTGAVSPGTLVTFVASASGFTDPTYNVSDSFSGGTAGSIDKVGFFIWKPTVSDAGRHTFTVTVTDPLQNTATSTVNIIVTGNSVLVGNLSPGPIVTPGRTITFSLTAPGFISPTYAVFDAPTMKVSSTNVDGSGRFSWTPGTDDIGVHTLTIMGSDAYGNSGQTQQTLTVVDPSLSFGALQPGQTVSAGSPVSFVVGTRLSNPTYSISDVSSGGTSSVTGANLSSNGVFTWTPTSADIGSHLITVVATDAYSNTASSTLSLWVTAASPTPTVTPSNTSSPGTPPASTSSATSSTRYMFTKNLVVGSKGTPVTELQKRLTVLGFYTGPITGTFGPLTMAAVKKFQAAHGIAKAGTVGPITRTALNKN